MSQLNERQVRLRKGGNFTTLDSYLDKRIVRAMPWSETQVVTLAGVSVAQVPNTLVAGSIYIDGSNTATGQGSVVAAAGAFTAGTPVWENTSLADVNGNLLNMVDVRDATTHDPVISSDRQVYGLIQAATGVADGTAISANNLQISFFYVAADGTITAASLTGDVEFTTNKEYKARYEPTITIEGGKRDVDVVSDSTAVRLTKYTVTTGTTAGNSVLDVAADTLSNSGVVTESGFALATLSSTDFNANTTRFYLNGVKQDKGVDVTFLTATTMQITLQLDAGDIFEIEAKV
jgi:hypothetical protein